MDMVEKGVRHYTTEVRDSFVMFEVKRRSGQDGSGTVKRR